MARDPAQSAPAQSRDAAAREAALRSILGAIARAREDETPVFDAILESAALLCNVRLVTLTLITEDGGHYDNAAERGASPEFVAFLHANPPELDPSRYVAARAMVEMRRIFDDLSDPALYGATDNVRTNSVSIEGIRSAFYVPLSPTARRSAR